MTDLIVTKRRMPGARLGLIGACQVGPITLQGGLLLLITWPAGPVRIRPGRRIEWLAPPRGQRTASPARKTIRVEPERAAPPSARVQAAPDQDQ